MEYRELGRTHIRVSEIGFGAGQSAAEMLAVSAGG